MKIKLDEGAFAPRRAFPSDAGLDLFAMESKSIIPYGSEVFHTGVHVELPPNTVGLLKSKSGLHVKQGITSEGVIDVGYTGEILVRLDNHSEFSVHIQAGQKITQLVIVPCLFEPVELVDELNTNTERKDRGFGSTGLF